MLLCAVVFVVSCDKCKKENMDWSKFPKEPEKVTWKYAVSLVRSGQVFHVSQAHSKKVWLRTYDYKYYVTIEPKINEIFRIVRLVDPKMKYINCETE
jgi:hypothetical protein